MGLDVHVIYAEQHLCYSEIRYIEGSLNSTIYKLNKSISENLLMDLFYIAGVALLKERERVREMRHGKRLRARVKALG